jgi:exonuclease SbcC
VIDRINFYNFKGQSGSQPLTGRDIFIGPNGSGKTTRIQAAGLSFLGYVPGNGKTEAETFKLATGNEMAVGLHTTEGFSFERQFTQTTTTNRRTGEGTVKISQSIEVTPGRGEANDTQRKQRIADEVGSFPVMLDFNEFLGLSDAKRRDFIYSLSTIVSDTWTKERIQEHLFLNLCTHELEKNNPEQYETMQALIDDAMQKFPDGWEVSDGLQAMIDWTSSQEKIWKAKKTDSQGAVRQLAELKNSLEETDRNISEEKAELEELQQKLIDAEKQISRNTEIKRIIDQRLARIEELKQQIAELENAPLEDADPAKYDSAIEEIRGKIENADFSEEIKKLNETIATARKEYEEVHSKASKLKEQIIQINAGMAGLEKSLATISGLGGHCIVDARIGCEKDFSKFRAFVEQKRAEATEAAANLRKEYDAAMAEEKRLVDVENEARKKIDELNKKSILINAANKAYNEMILDLERKKNETLNAEERRNNQIQLLKNELTRLMNEPAEAIAPLDILEKQAEGLRLRINELKTSIDEKGKARQTIILMQQSMLENKTAEIKAACLKSLSEELGPKGIQGELVKEILDPIRQDIRENLKAMGFDHEPFFQTQSDTGKEIFQFGWINEKGHQVNFDALSTGQQTVFLAAMMLVIIKRANPKLKMLVMDNLNHLDKKNFQMLLDGLSHIDWVDNIILAGAVEFDFEAPEGWKVWVLGKEDAANERKSA